MSKHETPLTRAYREQVGGTLVEEFPAVSRGDGRGPRSIDAIILPRLPKQIASWRNVDIAGQDIIVVQTKSKRLGMALMGQAVFSPELVKRFSPASVKSVAICTEDDSVLRPLAESHGIEVVVMKQTTQQSGGEVRG